ncbi:ABC transporter ATP-binding protein [Rhizobium sp. S9]|uniref:ABC transporter, ATP-binding protein n=2 Tax=Rhizobium etli TaxID=29449 RepID=Q2K0B5_RHIEC|nr:MULTISPECIES: ABC transporter ATP-binding protein [Rhizobium]ABC93559.1 putative ABC transporter, ATP-binding protein [Rhizobium etli CFN 42]AGS24740.1 nitrate/sulfonate ABC transporter ATP-binding protein [Rhizobium etli bv. mimosae str. Mim1]ARO27230.1 nitrate/sulfonate ABC transporter ATP-binding protein [Rhizobium sp. TAL182]ARQ12763.1 nitrate/sulfonate ABC transporter ATP-binding protein [Rhizobium etli]PDS98934.1 ABC transporter ATP-binding protein [Rhizobium sp. S9]
MSELKIEKVWKEYGDQIVLEDVSLTVASRAFVALVGPSGCGKTTFLRMLLGQEQPTKGKILLDGEPLPPEPGPDRGVVFQRYSVFPHLTVLGNVLLGREFSGARYKAKLFGAARRNAIEEARQLIAEVGLAGSQDKYPAQLSGGMQQRLALAQALIMKPKVLLLDEPFGALDPGIRAEIHTLMKRLWHETQMTVVMVTHDMREAFTLASRVVAFERRRDRPEEKERYGATITKDIAIWPPRLAGQSSIFSPDRDGPVASLGHSRDDLASSGETL